eukprot:CAMPEP_0197946826 /NCGR_PEP_ID=MMETSP1439-20131203/126599_1 /TAXON_ID=66791 /ORGANISM="Gonyaulax spinifera, Strain CCMP409" /LENGTH=57 /DNA_ID=CAMNT_0043570079 /DNA_START=1488 /DNA_END=1659 /DNA_ORIENTATION=-
MSSGTAGAVLVAALLCGHFALAGRSIRHLEVPVAKAACKRQYFALASTVAAAAAAAA